jgi:hypothetical protein
MPTGRGVSRLRPPQNRQRILPVTGPLSLLKILGRISAANGGSGTPLAVPGFAGTVANTSLAVTTRIPGTVLC